MRRHSIVVRLSAADKAKVIADKGSHVSTLSFISADKRLDHGLGQILDQLTERGMYPGETAIDLAILSATVTAADTRISRQEDAQDSWTREIDLYLPVLDRCRSVVWQRSAHRTHAAIPDRRPLAGFISPQTEGIEVPHRPAA